MKLSPPDLPSLQHICRNLRERDRIEAEASVRVFDPDQIAMSLLNGWRHAGAFGQVASLGDEPVALLNLIWASPVACHAEMLATDRWGEIAGPFARNCIRKIKPLVVKAGIRRIECRTWDGHDDARRWLEWFGAREECRISHWGKNGETFIQYGWTADVHEQPETDGGAGVRTADDHRHDVSAEVGAEPAQAA
jgi:hypothetical protein